MVLNPSLGMLLCSDAQAMPQSRLVGVWWNLSICASGDSWVIFMCSHVSDASRFHWDSPVLAARGSGTEMTSGGQLLYPGFLGTPGSGVYVCQVRCGHLCPQEIHCEKGEPATEFLLIFLFCSHGAADLCPPLGWSH